MPKSPDKEQTFGYNPDASFRIAKSISSERVRPLGAILCLLLPLTFFVVYFVSVHRFHAKDELVGLTFHFIGDASCQASPADSETGAASQKAATPRPYLNMQLKALDIAGWYTFSVPSAFLWFLSAIGFAFSAFVIGRRTNFMVFCTALVSIVVVGLAMAGYLDHNSDTRSILVGRILEAGMSAHRLPDLARQTADSTVAFNLRFGVVATLATLAALATVAVLASDTELNARVLRRRLSDMQWLMAAAASILILTVVVTKGMVGWALGLLCAPQAKALEPIAVALGNYWGALAVGVLGGALIPTYLAWAHDVSRFADKQLPDATEADRQKMIVAEGLNFNPTTSIATLMTIATPALVGPFIEVFKALLK